MKTIKVTEINIEMSDMWAVEKYPHTGMFLVNGTDMIYIYEDASGRYSYGCGMSSHYKFNEEQPQEQKQEGTISESFALKMLAVNNGHVNDLNLD